jgi:hypothetical protein
MTSTTHGFDGEPMLRLIGEVVVILRGPRSTINTWQRSRMREVATPDRLVYRSRCLLA